MTKDMIQSFETIIELGFVRILTSGQAKTAAEGIDNITKLVCRANNRIIIMPGSGVTCENLDMILSKTKTQEIHSSASSLFNSNMIYKNPDINMGSDSREFTWKVCVAEKVKELIDISKKY